MTPEAYLMRFYLLCRSVEKDENTLKMLASAPYQTFLAHFQDSRDPVLSAAVRGREEVTQSMMRKKRLCERYAARIARAIADIPSVELREYALCHYLYGMTHEAIAEHSFFSVRTVYRQARRAKEALKQSLLLHHPRLCRTPPARYRIVGKLLRKNLSDASFPPSLAAHYVRKRGFSSFTPYLPADLKNTFAELRS